MFVFVLGEDGVYVFLVGLDGIDGSSDVVGVFLMLDMLGWVWVVGFSLCEFLECNDFGIFFVYFGDVLVMGLSGYNFNDFWVLLVGV